MTDTSVRTCLVCGQRGLLAPRGVVRRYNCAYSTFDANVQPSEGCWRRRFPKCGAALLSKLAPIELPTAARSEAYTRTLRAMEQVAELFELGPLTTANAKALIAEHGLNRLSSIARRLGPDDELGKNLSSILRGATTPPRPPGAKRGGNVVDAARVADVRALPPDFASALDQWREICRDIERIKLGPRVQRRRVRLPAHAADRTSGSRRTRPPRAPRWRRGWRRTTSARGRAGAGESDAQAQTWSGQGSGFGGRAEFDRPKLPGFGLRRPPGHSKSVLLWPTS